jgi:hypothetical protein
MTTLKQITANSYQQSYDVKQNSTKQASSEARIQRLSRLIFPLTKPSVDQHGNTVQLWSIPESRAIAILTRPDGSTRYISSIRNPLNPTEDPVTLHNRLLIAPDCRWTYVTQENGSITIWPHLEAAGWKDAIPGPNQNLRGLTVLARGRTREQMCEWFYSNGYKMVEPKDNPRVEIHLHQGGFAGTYNANDHQTIQNLLRQGGYIKAIHHNPPHDALVEDNFVGRGITFSHPRDRNHTKFNVDYTIARKGRFSINSSYPLCFYYRQVKRLPAYKKPLYAGSTSENFSSLSSRSVKSLK